MNRNYVTAIIPSKFPLLQDIDIFTRKWLFFPIHSKAHWFLVVINLQQSCLSNLSVLLILTGSPCAIQSTLPDRLTEGL